MLYSKEYSFKGYTFLVSSLRDPVLEVLANDDMDLDFEPLQAWNRLSETQRENMFGREYQNVESTADLVANPNFMVTPPHTHARVRARVHAQAPVLLGSPVCRSRLLCRLPLQKHLHAVFDRLVSLCTRVIDGMTDACSTMPYSLRWIGKRLTEELKKAGLTAQEIWSALGAALALAFASSRYAGMAIQNSLPGSPTPTPVSSGTPFLCQ